jgi:HSP20 family protein
MRRDPFFMSPLMDLDRFWSDFDALAQRSTTYVPALDITETPESFVVSCELAGVPKENVKISLDGDVLTVHGEKKWEHEEKDAKMHRMERSYGSFSRSVRLPEDMMDPQQIKAQFKDGVLRITVPKRVRQETSATEIPIETM